jgi:hypothetical protein
MASSWKQRITRLRLIFEAFSYLAVARIAIRFLPFRLLIKSINVPSKTLTIDVRSQTIASVCAAVSTAAASLTPWAVCLPQALAGHWMLRRRGIASVVCFGARRYSENSPNAHAWLRAADHVVLGERDRDRFTPLIEFPPGH